MKVLIGLIASGLTRNCVDENLNYNGPVSVTESGKTCQRWDTNSPHQPKFRPDITSNNFCRNPDSDEKGPWCYTTDPETRYGYCNIPKCPPVTVCKTDCWDINGYHGETSHTADGVTCQQWDSASPHQTNYHYSHNFCRNPDNDSKGPWCHTVDPNTLFGYCDIKHCSQCRAISTQPPLEEILHISPVERQPMKCGIPAQPAIFPPDEDQPDELNDRGRPKHRSRRSSETSLEIYGGTVAALQRYPWQVKLSSRVSCGGSLLSLKTVVTAAHCVAKTVARDWTLSVGHIKKYENELSKQRRKCKRIIRHPEYDEESNDNDIAIMLTSTPFAYSKYVRPVCLPPPGLVAKGGSKCIITGWGKTEHGSTTTLMQNVIPMRSEETCKRLLGRLTDNMICGGKVNEDTCQGDSGGPLVCNVDGKFVLLGVTSFGFGCGEAGKPGVYAEVINYLNWINQHIE